MNRSGGAILLRASGLYVLLYCLILTTLSSLTLNASAALPCRHRLSGCTFQFRGPFLQKTARAQKSAWPVAIATFATIVDPALPLTQNENFCFQVKLEDLANPPRV